MGNEKIETDPLLELLEYEPKPWFFVRAWRYITDLLSSPNVEFYCTFVNSLTILTTSIMSAIWVDQYFGHQYNQALKQTESRAINDTKTRNYNLGESKDRLFSGQRAHALAGFVQFVCSAGTRETSFLLMMCAIAVEELNFSSRVKFAFLSLGFSALEFAFLYTNTIVGFYSTVGKNDGRSGEAYDWFYMLNCDYARFLRYGTNKTFHDGDPTCVTYCTRLSGWNNYKEDHYPVNDGTGARDDICTGKACEGLSLSFCNDELRRKQMPKYNNFTSSPFDNPPPLTLFFSAGMAFIIAAPACGIIVGLITLLRQRKLAKQELLQQRQNDGLMSAAQRPAFELL